MRSVWFPVLFVVVRLCVGGVFLMSGMMKLPDLGAFAQTVHAYAILPRILVNLFAIVVPWIEIVSGFCLFMGFWMRSNALILFFLLSSFIIAIGINLLRGVDLACGCFALDGLGGGLSEALIRDILLVIVVLLLFFTRDVILSLDRFLDHRKDFWHAVFSKLFLTRREIDRVV